MVATKDSIDALAVVYVLLLSETKNQPKEEVFGRTSLRISGQKLSVRPSKSWKTSALAQTCHADVHE